MEDPYYAKRFNPIHTQLLAHFLITMWKSSLYLIGNSREAIKTVWPEHRNKHIKQSNRIESTEININIYDEFVFLKDAKTIQSGK